MFNFYTEFFLFKTAMYNLGTMFYNGPVIQNQKNITEHLTSTLIFGSSLRFITSILHYRLNKKISRENNFSNSQGHTSLVIYHQNNGCHYGCHCFSVCLYYWKAQIHLQPLNRFVSVGYEDIECTSESILQLHTKFNRHRSLHFCHYVWYGWWLTIRCKS